MGQKTIEGSNPLLPAHSQQIRADEREQGLACPLLALAQEHCCLVHAVGHFLLSRPASLSISLWSNAFTLCWLMLLVLCLNMGRTYTFHWGRKTKRASK